MNLFQVFNSMSNVDLAPKVLVLRNGQVVNAAILDMFSNGDAKINIQGHILRAKLEVPMAKGEHTFMQVRSFDDGTINMSVLTNSDKKSVHNHVPINNLNDLIKNLNLPQNNQWREIVQQMISRQIPLLPEIIQNGQEILGKTPTQNQQTTWLTMLERSIPINQTTYQAVNQVIHGDKLGQLLTQLKSMVQQHIANNTQSIQNQQMQPNQQLAKTVQELNTIIPNQNINNVNINPVPSNIASNNPNQQQLNTAPSNNIPSTQMDSLIKINQMIDNILKQTLLINNNSNVNQASTKNTINTQPIPTQPLQISQPVITNQILDAIQNQLKQQINSQNITQNNQNSQAISNIQKIANSEQATVNPISNLTAPVSSTENIISSIMKMLGINYESRIKNVLQDMQQLNMTPRAINELLANTNADNLKQMLLQLTQNQQYPAGIRETAQSVINNLYGQQMLSTSSDSQSLYQSTLVQIPMQWKEGQDDTLTMQIQGRREKKALDPENCSIYIELNPPNLGELGTYIHVVRKVVTIRFFSENENLPNLAKNTEGLIKKGLENIGYQLSWLRVEKTKVDPKTDKQMARYQKQNSTGFDMRV